MLVVGCVVVVAGCGCWVLDGWLAFGTGEGLLGYGICVPCSKRLPEVRGAFSGALGAQNRLLRYGRDIRCAKQPPVVRDAFSKALGAQKQAFLYFPDLG